MDKTSHLGLYAKKGKQMATCEETVILIEKAKDFLILALDEFKHDPFKAFSYTESALESLEDISK